MANPCTVFLKNDTFYPGQTIEGSINCTFASEEIIKAIYIRFKGRARVYWLEIPCNSFKSDETYFEMESNLLTSETTFPPGKYSYPFTFNLPSKLPPTFAHRNGNIEYCAEAVIERSLILDYKQKRIFTVHAYIDVNDFYHLKTPVIIKEVKRSFSCYDEPGRINFSVCLPVTGFGPSQMVAFITRVKNDSKINVKTLRFQLVQGFIFYSNSQFTKAKTYVGEIFEVIDGLVEPGKENSWNLEIRIPAVPFTEDMKPCNIIRSFTELRGKLVLPIPHKNLRLRVPITIGSVPLRSQIN